jgi:hypothetical protein
MQTDPNRLTLWKRIKRKCYCCFKESSEELTPQPARPSSTPTQHILSPLPCPQHSRLIVTQTDTQALRRAKMQRSQIMSSPPTMKGIINGHRHSSYFSETPPSPSSTRFGGSTKTTVARRSQHFSNNDKTSIVRETAIALKQKSNTELGKSLRSPLKSNRMSYG